MKQRDFRLSFKVYGFCKLLPDRKQIVPCEQIGPVTK